MLEFSCDQATELSLNYGGTGGFLPWAPSPMGLSVDPSDLLRLSFLAYANDNGENMSLDAVFGATKVSTTLTTSGPQIIDIPLNGFGATTLDFLTIDFHAPIGTSFQLESVSLVTAAPEPGSLAIISIPALLLLRRNREVRS